MARLHPYVNGIVPNPFLSYQLAGRHARDDVVHTLIRLAVTGQVEETGGKYALTASEP